ncbi:type I DNA topoisomerase [Arcanobacterium bovis]|uniref:DNA topoisomerase 1 n=1 Tax=Arcanobacterium bovis TaxID=2529275 RepID=A0A4Q9V2Q7_9ACTO|nr:type I DNA topoisomerase [Arcanobacterium bovis]TBW23900.1 type I DNA topoisomerase [Arcanobacterium bovis]
MTKLVIVESPAKARTIGNYLGADYEVEASIGHIRDLPKPSDLPADMKKGPFGKFAVDVDGDFEPYYVVTPDKKKKVTELRSLLKKADELYLATDEDREGEAIAWHLLEALKPKVPVKRMVFHEITKEAIGRALENTRELDTKLVDAQESRRILDRLVGYEVSPLLWRKVAPSLSAGRVQSVTTRIIVERERERMAFKPANYWDVTVSLVKEGEDFEAKLTSIDGARIATGKDFGDNGTLTEKATSAGVLTLNEELAQALAKALGSGEATVASVETKPYRRRPAAPFTTSTLQQEASRKLRLSSRDTMRLAQSLYENGYITYMRTDSVNLSEQAISAARAQIKELYGAESLPNSPRHYATKSKGAQEAHEAIRPAGDHFRTPLEVQGQLQSREYALYELIWKRTVASQMADATGLTASIKIVADLSSSADTELAKLMSESNAAGKSAEEATMSASGTIITFPGFMAAYEEGQDTKRYEEKAESRLPDLIEGEQVNSAGAKAEGHDTAPPPRYTEASLVKTLEEKGIGRPSTYASTISTITDRGYVERKGQALVPTWLAFSVVRLLEDNLPELVDYDFTADMEHDLDRIAAGEQDRVKYLANFYRGTKDASGLRDQVGSLGDIDARAVNTIEIGDGIAVRVGRFGPYLEETNDDGTEGRRASVPPGVAPDELTVDRAKEILEQALQGDRVLGKHPDTGYELVVKDGRFGPYVCEVLPDDAVQLTPTGKVSKAKPKPQTASLFRSMQPDTVTLDQAVQLLSLPREVGESEGEMITAQNGRYGPYLKRGSDSRSLESEEQIFSITLAEAEEIFKQPKVRGRAAAKPPLAEFGKDLVSGGTIVLKDGRFGPYVTDGETNASVPRSEDINQLTAERAQELLVARRLKVAENGGPKKRNATKRTVKAGTRKTTKKTTAKKSTTKSSTAKKPAAKAASKTTAKKSATEKGK